MLEEQGPLLLLFALQPVGVARCLPQPLVQLGLGVVGRGCGVVGGSDFLDVRKDVVGTVVVGLGDVLGNVRGNGISVGSTILGRKYFRLCLQPRHSLRLLLLLFRLCLLLHLLLGTSSGVDQFGRF